MPTTFFKIYILFYLVPRYTRANLSPACKTKQIYQSINFIFYAIKEITKYNSYKIKAIILIE